VKDVVLRCPVCSGKGDKTRPACSQLVTVDVGFVLGQQ
jgi:hypothetical protein